MATRSRINVKVGNKYHSVYCHYDGYPEHVGRILFDHYNTQGKAEGLVSYGDISCLYERFDKPEGHSFESPVEGCTIYYGRDRGESNIGFKVTDEPIVSDFCGEDYFYIWDGNQWSFRVYRGDESVSLIDYFRKSKVSID
ncbi:hypothetical protein LPW36_02145 [Jinshanibacter sp. LJY008]|uniref:Uncharacterized protein n=1 Tax=Limnobaculum eriocheiris TaxID=2897391 RepID=A0A9X1MSS1_9GAMM|nr:hypothetical protein [Limnobaculum eriocheiris]MCD1124846.1 hypothetical protein [Limnobaculum eriocheiris]